MEKIVKTTFKNKPKNKNKANGNGFKINRQMPRALKINKQVKRSLKLQKGVTSLFRNPVNKNESHETSYLYSLLNPETANLSKIPGGAVPVVPIHRKIIYRATTNALGCFAAIAAFDNFVFDNATMTQAPIWFFNNIGYDGSAAATTANAVTYANCYNIPAGTVKQYRIVSGSIKCRSLSSNLNRTGDLHIGFFNGASNLIGAGASPDFLSYTVLSSLQNLSGGRYSQAHAEAGQCVRGIWVPQDITCLDFKLINYVPGTTPQDNYIAIIGIGLPASSTVEFEYYVNLEVTVAPGSILAGMDQICTSKIQPTAVWQTVHTKSDVTQAILDNGCSVNSGLNMANKIVADSSMKAINGPRRPLYYNPNTIGN